MRSNGTKRKNNKALGNQGQSSFPRQKPLSKIDKLTVEISGLTKVIINQSALITDLRDEVKQKDERIAELEARLGMNSGNSSKPPSTDYPTKPHSSKTNKNKGLGRRKERQSGGQKGHEGTTLEVENAPDTVKECLPSKCASCPHFSACKDKARLVESRHVLDMKIVSLHERYDLYSFTCPETGTELKGKFPADVQAPVQYGKEVKTFVVLNEALGLMSSSRLREILGSMGGFAMSDGTVYNMIGDCAKRCKDNVLPQLKDVVLSSDVAHFDETGLRSNGKNLWAHTSSTKNVTLVSAHEKRGKEGTLAAGVLQNFKGVAVHDCWAAYNDDSFSGATHSICGAHIDRECEGVVENKHQRWARRFQLLLGEMYGKKTKLQEAGHTSAPQEMIDEYSKRYDKIIEEAYSRNPWKQPKRTGRGRFKRGKVLSLIDRLKNLKEQVMRFFTDFKVPFSNNVGEKSFRLFKTKMKVSGGFRSQEGGKNFCAIYSVIDTARKNHISPYAVIRQIFSGSYNLDFLVAKNS
jgi:transposase